MEGSAINTESKCTPLRKDGYTASKVDDDVKGASKATASRAPPLGLRCEASGVLVSEAFRCVPVKGYCRELTPKHGFPIIAGDIGHPVSENHVYCTCFEAG